MERSRLIVDVGGTKTRIFLLSSPHRTQTLPSNPKKLISSLKTFIKRHKIRDFSLNAGFRGVWTRKQRLSWASRLQKLSKWVKVQSDIELAYELIFGKKPGIVVNAGTGSIAYGQKAKGRWARAGGMGPTIGDQGSAFWIGKEYTKRKNRSSRKRMIINVYSIKPQQITKVAKVGFDLVRKFPKIKNRMAILIIREALHHLSLLVQNVQAQLKIKQPVSVGLVGGLFENEKFRRRFILAMKREGFEVLRKRASI